MRPGLHAHSLKAPESPHGSPDYPNCDAKIGIVTNASKRYHINYLTYYIKQVIS